MYGDRAELETNFATFEVKRSLEIAREGLTTFAYSYDLCGNFQQLSDD